MTMPFWAVVVLTAALVTPTEPPSTPPPGYGAQAEDNEILVTAVTAAGVIARSEATDPALRLHEYTRRMLCGVEAGENMNTDCTGYDPNTPLPDCEGLEPVPPLWHRSRATPTSP